MELDFDHISFEIISFVGIARSRYIEAIQKAKIRDFKEASHLIQLGDHEFIQGHKLHQHLFATIKGSLDAKTSLLLMHTEDILMSAESFKIIAEEIIELYKINKT